MSWVAVGVAGGTALLGHMNAQQQQKQKQQEMMANAEQIRQSPWTGIKAGIIGGGGTPDPGIAAAQGALGGYMQGRSIMNTNAANKEATEMNALDKQKKQLEIDEMKRKSQQSSAFSGMGNTYGPFGSYDV